MEESEEVVAEVESGEAIEGGDCGIVDTMFSKTITVCLHSVK